MKALTLIKAIKAIKDIGKKEVEIYIDGCKMYTTNKYRTVKGAVKAFNNSNGVIVKCGNEEYKVVKHAYAVVYGKRKDKVK